MVEQLNERHDDAAPVLLKDKDAAALCGVSRSHWRAMHSAGQVPLPVRLGKAVRWDKREVLAWIAAGCPARSKWVMVRDKAMARRAS